MTTETAPISVVHARTRPKGWRGLVVTALVIAIYLALWVAYTANGLVDYGRYRQLPPGATASFDGVHYRLLSLKQSSLLLNQSEYDTEPQASAPDTVWVVAEIELTRLPNATAKFCSVVLKGPGRREWDTESPSVIRNNYETCDIQEKLKVGMPATYEAIFQVPTSDVGRIEGIAVNNVRNSDPDQVIRPA